jgi:hypothetical protein
MGPIGTYSEMGCHLSQILRKMQTLSFLQGVHCGRLEAFKLYIKLGESSSSRTEAAIDALDISMIHTRCFGFLRCFTLQQAPPPKGFP